MFSTNGSVHFLLAVCMAGFSFAVAASSVDGGWYVPANIGNHVDHNNITERQLDAEAAKTLLVGQYKLHPQLLKRYQSRRDSWLKKNRSMLQEKKNRRRFILAKDHKITPMVYAFTKDKARIYIVFQMGYFRWHRHYVMLDHLLIDRNKSVDHFLGLDKLEKRYTVTRYGIKHGMTISEVHAKLGSHIDEYGGQSPQYRNIYFPDYNIEVVVQNGIVKYIVDGKPGWLKSRAVKKR